jgi:uncharacterized protein (DUF4415 family)
MRKKSATVRYTAKQIKRKIARGEDRTDWRKVDQVTGTKLDASIHSDPDEGHAEPDWTKAVLGTPTPKDHINIRIDHDVLEWFKSNGKGYQTLMNNVLRAFVQTRQQGAGHKSKLTSPSHGKEGPRGNVR